MIPPRLLAAALVAASLLGAPASAQNSESAYRSRYGFSFNNPTTALVDGFVWDRMNARLIYRMGLKRKGFTDEQLAGLSTEQLKEAYLSGGIPDARPAEPPTPEPPATPASRFKPSGAPVLVPRLIEGLTEDPATRKSLAEYFQQVLAAFEAEAAKQGFEHDVAAAISFFTAAAFQLLDGAPPDDASTNLLARALQISMESPEYRKVPDLEKQQFYEFMIVMGGYLLAAAESGDTTTLSGLKEASADVLRQFLKLDPAKVKLTPRGIESR